MKQKDLSDDIARTYLTLRVLLGLIGLTLPVLLWFGYFLITGDIHLQHSMSAYYHAEEGAMRVWFVGLLFVVGALLITYHGFTWPEDWALNLAGVLAVGVAIFPMPWPPEKEHGFFSLHGACAVTFFACIVYVCLVQASATLYLINDQKRRQWYSWIYKIFGVLMVLSPIAALIMNYFPSLHGSLIFFVEAFGVVIFSLYWIVKTREIIETRADHKAARGELQRPAYRLLDIFRTLPVTESGK